MKIKDKVSGEIYEAESWKNWNGVVQYVKKGTNGPIRYADDVEILKEEVDYTIDIINNFGFWNKCFNFLAATFFFFDGLNSCTSSIEIR